MRSWAAPHVPRLPGRGPEPSVFDTAAGAVRPLGAGPEVLVYVCGITPYDATHLGHASTYLAFDTLTRVLLDAGHTVRSVQNVTDVDDPLLERAERDGIDWRDLAERETELFRSDMTALRILPPVVYEGVVEAVDRVSALVETLVKGGAGYRLDGGDVYFDISSAAHFGEVGHLGVAEMLALSAQRGGDPDRPGKRNALDPLLWRAERAGEPAWDSPVGRGRPGWHVECAAIALEHLGPSIDVQGGGADLVFPHHEMSTAHAEVASGVAPFARHFMHAALVSYRGEKMSKSLGNLVKVSDLLPADVDPMAIRLALLSQHYREPWEWTPALLSAAEDRLARWSSAVAGTRPADSGSLLVEVRARLADDLDTPGALRAVDRWAGAASHPTSPTSAATVRDIVDALLGISLPWACISCGCL